jgi:hypothetical protein
MHQRVPGCDYLPFFKEHREANIRQAASFRRMNWDIFITAPRSKKIFPHRSWQIALKKLRIYWEIVTIKPETILIKKIPQTSRSRWYYGFSIADPNLGSGAFFTPWIRIRDEFFPDPGGMFFDESFLRIRVLLFFPNKTCPWNHKEQEKGWFYFSSLFLCTVGSGSGQTVSGASLIEI